MVIHKVELIKRLNVYQKREANFKNLMLEQSLLVFIQAHLSFLKLIWSKLNRVIDSKSICNKVIFLLDDRVQNLSKIKISYLPVMITGIFFLIN